MLKRLILLIILILGLFSCVSKNTVQEIPLAVNGFMDISNWDFQNNGIVKLDGEWELYWKKLLTPADLKNNPDPAGKILHPLPKKWNGLLINNEKLTGWGYATFRLKIKLPPDAKKLAIRTLDVRDAYKIWINDELIVSSGIIGKNENESLGDASARTSVFTTETPDIELLMQISNFRSTTGGIIRESIRLGTAQQIQDMGKRHLIIEAFMAGILIIMGLYHLMLYFFRKKDTEPLLFGLFCLLASLRTLCGNEGIFNFLFIANNLVSAKAIYFSVFVGAFLFIQFMYRIFPLDFNKKIVDFFSFVYLSSAIVSLLLPLSIYNIFKNNLQLGILVGSSYIFISILRALINKRESSSIFIIGIIVMFIAIINDFLYAYQYVHTGWFIQYSIFIFILLLSAVYSMRFSNAFSNVEILSEMFRKFVPQQFLKRIANEGIKTIRVGKAESEELTILFTDIRSFTDMSENMEPQQVLNFLNAYFKEMNNAIHENRGFIDKFIGDAIMAVFDHDSPENQAEKAILAAIEMQRSNLENNEKWKEAYGCRDVITGIGIHTGKVILGTVGSDDRMDSTVLGDNVNLASRLEGLTKHYRAQIIISDITFQNLKNNNILCRELDYISVKGKQKPVRIYEVYNANPAPVLAMKQKIQTNYKKGLSLYYQQNWSEALKQFEKCLSDFPGDYISSIYLERCQQYLIEPPAPNWDGIVKMTEK